MLLMRHDNRATFGRALEDLNGRHRHAARPVVEAFGDVRDGLGGEFVDPRADVRTTPEPVPMSSRFTRGTLVPRSAVSLGRAFPACNRFRENLVACIFENRHHQSSTCSQVGFNIYNISDRGHQEDFRSSALTGTA